MSVFISFVLSSTANAMDKEGLGLQRKGFRISFSSEAINELEDQPITPSPNNTLPLEEDKNLCFVKNIITNNNIIVGDYTYYYDPDDVYNFEKNVLYHYEALNDKLIIGKFCQIGTAVKFIMNGGNHRLDGFSTFPFQAFGGAWKDVPTSGKIKGDTKIGNDVWIGYGAVILPGISIGDGAIVGACSCVTKDVDPYTIVIGNPAVRLRSRFDEDIINFLLSLRWWDWPIQQITQYASEIVNGNRERLEEVSRETGALKRNSMNVSPGIPFSLTPGVYESDDAEWILSIPLNDGEEGDCIIFDVDEVLCTGFVPFYCELSKKYANLYERLFLENKSMGERFLSYAYSQLPWAYMDEKLPSLLKKIQLKKVRCIANTALDPIVDIQLNLDLPSARIETLRKLHFDFSQSFKALDEWDFSTLESNSTKRYKPLFKEGIIFSSDTPKHITTIKLFEKLDFIPRRAFYIDDSHENAQEIYDALASRGIECYSFCYSKKKTKTLQNFFEDNVFEAQIEKLEIFLNKLLSGEDVIGV